MGLLTLLRRLLIDDIQEPAAPVKKPSKDEVDHSLIHTSVWRTPSARRFNSEAVRPLIERAMEGYRFGPREGQVYHLLKDRREATFHGPTIGLSHEEMVFVSKHAGTDWLTSAHLLEGVAE